MSACSGKACCHWFLMSAMGMGEQAPYVNICSNVDIFHSGFNPQHQVYTGLQLQRPVWFSDLHHLSSLSLRCLGPTEDSVVQIPRPLGPYNKWNVRIWVIIKGSVTGQLCWLGPQVPELGVWLWFYDPTLTLCYSSNGRDWPPLPWNPVYGIPMLLCTTLVYSLHAESGDHRHVVRFYTPIKELPGPLPFVQLQPWKPCPHLACCWD